MNKDVKKETEELPETSDPTAASRKKDHIELAFRSQIKKGDLDERFFYEPVLSGHPDRGSLSEQPFLGKTMHAPMWVSSMTGGTEMAGIINRNLARACCEFGMGMGLGSCRSLLHSKENLADFDVRDIIGAEQLLFANLGIAQLEEIVAEGSFGKLDALVDLLRADGLIIHVNPLQEWLQPEGDRFCFAPLETIQAVLDMVRFPVIVKEVGQGMGYHSLKALFQLPLAAIDFAANGGTNFARLELLRSDDSKQQIYKQLAFVGHSAEEMVDMVNQLILELGDAMQCREVIISGGVRDFLDGFYLTNKVQLNAVYGQASAFLNHARGTYEELYHFVDSQVQGLELARAFLKCKP